MERINELRHTAVLYTCGICNLNCRYCTIDKNPVLKEIDNELEESFKGDYYFNRIKKYFPRPDMLKRVETWGGEPFLRMDRIYPLIHQLIDYYPYFESMFSSTNFSYDGWIDQFMGLMDCFAAYPHRHFEYNLQLSVDGPEELNDGNRGKGVTQRCIKNFDKLISIIKEGKFPKNVTLIMMWKGTWDADCIRKLDTKEKIIEFFQFYENTYMDKVVSLGDECQFPLSICIPNTAIPAPTTKEDGILFCELIKKCREIEAENRTEHYFKYYKEITPYHGPLNFCNGFCGDEFGCGSGSRVIGFLPHDMVSACHEGFTLLAEQYKEFAAKRSSDNLTVTLNKFFELQATPMCLTDEQFKLHEQKMSYICPNSPVQASVAVALIISLAMSGLIDKKYTNEAEALTAAKYVMGLTTYCIKANYAITGSFVLEPTGLYILLLNGALDYLM